MEKHKVIQIIDSSNVGGAEVLAVNISNALSTYGIESHLCVTRKEGELKQMIDSSKNYIFLEKKRTIDAKAIKKLRNYIRFHNINILHAHSSSYFIATCVKIMLPKVKIIWHDHYGNSEFLTRKSRLPVRIASIFFKVAIAVNTRLFVWNKKHLFSKTHRLLHNFPEFTDLSQTTFLKGEEHKRIVHVAGFREQKDHMTLIKAFQKVLEKHPKWTLHLIGKSYNDEYSNKVLSYISDKELQKSIFFYGLQTDIKHILSQSSIGVLSSKSEGLPISLLEYGLAGLSVVVTNVGECGELVRDKRVVVSPQDPKDFSEAILFLIESANSRGQIAAELSSIISKNYNAESFFNKLANIYNQIV